MGNCCAPTVTGGASRPTRARSYHRRRLPQAAGGDQPGGDGQDPGGHAAAPLGLRAGHGRGERRGAAWWRTVRHFIDEMERSELYGELVFSRDLERTLIKGLMLAHDDLRLCSYLKTDTNFDTNQ